MSQEQSETSKEQQQEQAVEETLQAIAQAEANESPKKRLHEKEEQEDQDQPKKKQANEQQVLKIFLSKDVEIDQDVLEKASNVCHIQTEESQANVIIVNHDHVTQQDENENKIKVETIQWFLNLIAQQTQEAAALPSSSQLIVSSSQEEITCTQ